MVNTYKNAIIFVFNSDSLEKYNHNKEIIQVNKNIFNDDTKFLVLEKNERLWLEDWFEDRYSHDHNMEGYVKFISKELYDEELDELADSTYRQVFNVPYNVDLHKFFFS